MRIKLSPIGFIQNRYSRLSKKVHIRAKRSKIVLLPEYAEGLYRIKQDKYLEVIFYFHKSKGYRLVCQTPHWGVRGVFACRSPFRPVPLGLTKVKLISVKNNELVVEGLDAVSGTPVLDIKPYVDWCKRRKEMPNHEKQKRSKKRN
ncbi:MAG: tRNA (N6-threonylcarbamoyladenosine(37)-N6)-methyltransferase TrmO [Candidatus Omnitrophica bacterium]|nr:tRNA (N6-threonylcarbamoyladenosine(37)-N6)-methyltransferase TrmO [Candidatus Omnitrophota bacterium]